MKKILLIPLTPQQALECLRECRDMTISADKWTSKWGDLDPVGVAINALEDALAQKPACDALSSGVDGWAHHANEWADAATNVPALLDLIESGQMTIAQAREANKSDCEHARSTRPNRTQQKHPAAPVPSDKEIVDAIKRSETWGDKTNYSALRLLARRIGVQGVPQ